MIVAFALSLALGAGAPSILLPPWPLSPDGDRVVALGAPLTAEGAAVEREAGDLWRVVPEAGRATVLLRAGSATAEAPVEPPPGRIWSPPTRRRRSRGAIAACGCASRCGAPRGHRSHW